MNINNNIDVPVLAYIAGFIDGEGCISIVYVSSSIRNHRKYPKLRVAFNQKDRSPLDFIISYFGGTVLNTKNGYYKLDYVSNNAYKLLQLVVPYLILKKDEALLGIKFQSQKQSKQGKAYRLSVTDDDVQYSQFSQMAGLKNHAHESSIEPKDKSKPMLPFICE